jgi:hypothetical protein
MAKSLDSVPLTRYSWVADTGSTCHLTNNLEGMFDVKQDDSQIQIGDGKYMQATKIGKLNVTAMQKDGTTTRFTLDRVKYVPELHCNLFSLTAAIKNGCQLGNKGLSISLRKGPIAITFDRHVGMTNGGYLSTIELVPMKVDTGMVSLTKERPEALITLHRHLGHAGEAAVQATAKYLNVTVTCPTLRCEDCALGKAKQKNVNKCNVDRSTTPGERLCIDISSIKSTSFGGKKFWLLVVDEATGYKWSFFLKRYGVTMPGKINP